jgi:transposase
MRLLLERLSADRMDTILDSTMSRDEMEQRRLAAATDLQNGMSQSRVARKFGVSRTTASRWHRALNSTAGSEALRKRKATGRPCRLTKEQLSGIPALFAQGAAAFGFTDNRWTTARLATVIEQRYAVKYDHDHVGRLMHKLGLRDSDSRRKRDQFTPAFAPVAYPMSA